MTHNIIFFRCVHLALCATNSAALFVAATVGRPDYAAGFMFRAAWSAFFLPHRDWRIGWVR